MPQLPDSPRTNRIGCLIIFAVLAILFAAAVYAGLAGKPEPENDRIPMM